MTGNYGYLHLGRIVSYDEVAQGYSLTSIGLARTQKWGPCASTVPGLLVDDQVVLAATGTTRDNLVIIGKVGNVFPDIDDIPGLVAALNAKADDTEITVINGRLGGHDADLTALNAALTALTGVVGGHTTLLSSHTTTLGTYGTRITAQEAKVGYVEPVASAGGRPSTGLYNGYPIYRTDKAFMEFYNGAGAWRLRQFSLVAALADVDFPVGGQVVILATDLMLYRYDSGTAAWIAIMHTVPGGGHCRYRLAAGHPNIAASTVSKVALSVAESTTPDVTQSADFKEFTLVRGGTWDFTCKLPWSGGTTGGASRFSWVAPSTDNTIRYAGGSTPPSSFIMVPGGTDTVRLVAGTKLSVWAYQDSAVGMGFDITGMQGNFTARWMGP